MKKIISAIAVVVILASCSTSQQSSNNTDTAIKQNLTKHKFNGLWLLDDISYDQPDGGTFKIDALGQGDPKCMLNSQWNLIANNNSGAYTLAGNTECNTGTDNISWHIVNETTQDVFKYKVITPGTKAKENTMGYAFVVESIDESSFSLRSKNTISGESKTFDIIYHFTKQLKK